MSAWKHGLAVGLLAGLAAIPAEAQTGKFGLGLHGGTLKPGEIAEANGNHLQVERDFSYGGGLEYWMGRVGLRADYTHMETKFNVDNFSLAAFGANQVPLALSTLGPKPDMHLLDASLMFRLLPVVQGRKFAPFVSLGAGGVWWDPEDPGNAEEAEAVELGYVWRPADVVVAAESLGEPAAVLGIGTDWFVKENAAIRLEIKDHYVKSPYFHYSDHTDRHGRHHNINFSAGVQLFMGGGVREPGFVQRTEPAPEPARPAPAPAPQPRPAPAPEARFENINMCVVGDNGRLMTVSAVRNLDTRAVLVDRNGSRVAFETAYPVREPLYVRSSSWYVSDRPLIVDIDAAAGTENRIEFVRFGATSTVPMNDLTWVGNVNGTPVYVRNSDATDIRTSLDAHLRMHSDLATILTADRELAEGFGEIETFYVPVETGCVFQPVSSTLIVRRTRG